MKCSYAFLLSASREPVICIHENGAYCFIWIVVFGILEAHFFYFFIFTSVGKGSTLIGTYIGRMPIFSSEHLATGGTENRELKRAGQHLSCKGQNGFSLLGYL